MATYQFKRGDSLFSVAKKHKLNYLDLLQANKTVSQFKPGVVIALPKPTGIQPLAGYTPPPDDYNPDEFLPPGYNAPPPPKKDPDQKPGYVPPGYVPPTYTPPKKKPNQKPGYVPPGYTPPTNYNPDEWLPPTYTPQLTPPAQQQINPAAYAAYGGGYVPQTASAPRFDTEIPARTPAQATPMGFAYGLPLRLAQRFAQLITRQLPGTPQPVQPPPIRQIGGQFNAITPPAGKGYNPATMRGLPTSQTNPPGFTTTRGRQGTGARPLPTTSTPKPGEPGAPPTPEKGVFQGAQSWFAAGLDKFLPEGYDPSMEGVWYRDEYGRLFSAAWPRAYVVASGFARGEYPTYVLKGDQQALGLTDAELEAAGYFKDPNGNWIRMSTAGGAEEPLVAPGYGGGGGGGYYGRGGGGGGGGYGGGGGGGGGYGSYGGGSNRFTGNRATVTGRYASPPQGMGQISWRI